MCPQQLNEQWSSYPETVLYFATDPEIMVDLRAPVSKSMRLGLAAAGLRGDFGILTSFNPRGQHLGNAENATRLELLERELRSSGDSYIRVDACSPDKTHCECSVAVFSSMERCIDIARKWEQIAIFWFDGSGFWIYGAIEPIEPIKLPVN